ncbi:MAG: hypothetical protein ACQET5_16385 [Halobacteriota archaeon]
MRRRTLLVTVAAITNGGCTSLIDDNRSTENSDGGNEVAENETASGETVLARLPNPEAFDADYEVVDSEFSPRREDSTGRTYQYSGPREDRPQRLRIGLVEFPSNAEAAAHFHDVLEHIQELYSDASEHVYTAGNVRSVREFRTWTSEETYLAIVIAHAGHTVVLGRSEDRTQYDHSVLRNAVHTIEF